MRKLLNDKQVEIIKGYAVGMVLIENARMSFEDLVEEFSNGNIPKGVKVALEWQDDTPEEISQNLQDTYAVLEMLGEELLANGGKK